MKKTLLATTCLLACAACAPAALQPASAVAPAPAPALAVSAGALTSAQGRNEAGSIGGTVATNPYHAVKVGGVVFLEDGPRDSGTPASATLDNHDMEFVPSIVVVPAGGSVIFTNTDPLMHNVFSPDGEKWNLGEIPQNGSLVKRFDTPGAYTVLCNLHTSMIAHLLVTPSGHFTRTDTTGGYVLKNVPPGTYHVTAWVPRLKPVTQSVTVTVGEVTANFDLER
jgi:plastocyanin